MDTFFLARTHYGPLQTCLHSFRVDSPSCTSEHEVLMHSDCADWAAERHRGLQTRRASICSIAICKSIAHGVRPGAHVNDRLWHDPVHLCLVSACAACQFSCGSLLLQAGFVQATQFQSTHSSDVWWYRSQILGTSLAHAPRFSRCTVPSGHYNDRGGNRGGPGGPYMSAA